MNRPRLTTLAAIGVAAFLGACATEVPTQVTGAQATVINRTGQPITSISYQPCGSTASAWAPLAMPVIAPQASVVFTLPTPCTNLRAHYADGNVAGMHSGVKWNFPFTWVLS
ncbi:MAG: hypothetical protein AB7O49_21135 [Sphingomonadales bacterium]